MTALLQQWVTIQAEQRPEAIALVLNEETVTYGELERASNQLARVLREGGCTKGERICFLIPKGPAAIISILGTLKADCLYVPLDPSSPAPRLAHMVTSCEPRWILATTPTSRLLNELWVILEEKLRSTISIGMMDGGEEIEGNQFRTEFTRNNWSCYAAGSLHYQNNEQAPAYLLYTSGSTGRPKGVVITHSSVIHFVEWATKYFGIDHSDRISGHPPLNFDLSVFDIFGTFKAGAQLHLVPQELNLLPNKLAEFIRTSQLTQWFSVPSTLSYMAKFEVVKFNDFPRLKRLLWCGEVFPTPSLKYWMKRLPHVTFTNLYGPTEATIASSYYAVSKCPDDEQATIPIGTACDGEELLVLDETLHPIPPGEVGDLYIRGVGLSPGYWREPDKTRAVFLRNPFSADPSDLIYKTGDLAKIGPDGLVYFIGRADTQIKCRGYRIELGEIETALNALPSVQECAVVAINTDEFVGTVICCAYVPAPGAEVTPVALRKELSKTLPTYMLPARWKAFEQFPTNASGKIDRRKLREEFLQNWSQGVDTRIGLSPSLS